MSCWLGVLLAEMLDRYVRVVVILRSTSLEASFCTICRCATPFPRCRRMTYPQARLFPRLSLDLFWMCRYKLDHFLPVLWHLWLRGSALVASKYCPEDARPQTVRARESGNWYGGGATFQSGEGGEDATGTSGSSTGSAAVDSSGACCSVSVLMDSADSSSDGGFDSALSKPSSESGGPCGAVLRSKSAIRPKKGTGMAVQVSLLEMTEMVVPRCGPAFDIDVGALFRASSLISVALLKREPPISSGGALRPTQVHLQKDEQDSGKEQANCAYQERGCIVPNVVP